MSKIAERCLVQHLVDPDSLAVLADEGLPPEAIPTEEFRPVVEWSLDYFHRSGTDHAPSPDALRTRFGQDFFDDHEVDIEDMPDDTIEWAIEDLKSDYLLMVSQRFTREFAIDVNDAVGEQRIAVVREAADVMVSLAMDMARKSMQVDLREAVTDRIMAYEQREADRDNLRGMSLGFPEIDAFIGGIHPGELAVVGAPPKTGKALSVDTPILTTQGWTTMGEVMPGQSVYSMDGTPTEVVAATEVMLGHDCYRVTFRSGATLIADREHLWWVVQRSDQRVVATDELAQGRHGRRWLVPVVEELESPAVDIPLDPWVLGYWLANGSCGDGLLHCHPDDRDEVVAHIEGAGLQVGAVHRGSVRALGLKVILRDLGVLRDKHVPEQYLLSGTSQRRALLSGLCDGDSFPAMSRNGSGSIEFSQVENERLVDQVAFLVRSLGFKTTVGKGRATLAGVDHGPKFRVLFAASRSDGPVTFSRRLEALPERPRSQRSWRDAVVSVEQVPSVPVRCISVAHPTGTYAAGSELTVTHNSMLGAFTALKEWQRGKRPILFTLENSVEMTIDRIACMAEGVSASRWQHGQAHPVEVERVRKFAEQVAGEDTPLWVVQPEVDRRTVDMMVREAILRGANSLIIDQLTFVRAKDERAQRYLQIREMLHDLKEAISTARLRLPCLLFHQINRDGVKEADKIGHLQMHHFAEGSEVERTADFGFGLYQGLADRNVGLAKFQMLAARRTPFRHWELNWGLDQGNIDVIRTIDLGE